MVVGVYFVFGFLCCCFRRGIFRVRVSMLLLSSGYILCSGFYVAAFVGVYFVFGFLCCCFRRPVATRGFLQSEKLRMRVCPIFFPGVSWVLAHFRLDAK
jgi:hypothetical protein